MADQRRGHEPWSHRRGSMSRSHFRYFRRLRWSDVKRSGMDCRRHIPRAYILLVLPPMSPDWSAFPTGQKNVYSVFRSNPPAVGFAQLSSLAGGSSGSQRSSYHNVIIYARDACIVLLIRHFARVPEAGPSSWFNTNRFWHVYSSFRDLGTPSTSIGGSQATGTTTSGSGGYFLLFTLSR